MTATCLFLFLVVGCILILLILIKKSATERYSYSLPLTPSNFNCDIDKTKVKDGLAFFKTKKLVICGLIRNSEKTVELISRQIAAVGSLFADYRAIIVENDSTDRTREWLLQIVDSNPKIKVLGCGVNSPICTMNLKPTIQHDRAISRIEKMVLLRNMYLQEIQTDPAVKDFDFVLMWDLDIRGEFYLDGVGTCGWYFNHGINSEKVNVLCSNAVIHINNDSADPITSGKYYDPYAYKDFSQVKTFTTIDDVDPPSCAGDPIHLKSCFNGLALYRKTVLTGHKYGTEAIGNESLCEHVVLHSDMNNIYLNRSFLYIIDQEKDI